jgi:hypothetical protein
MHFVAILSDGWFHLIFTGMKISGKEQGAICGEAKYATENLSSDPDYFDRLYHFMPGVGMPFALAATT